MAARSRANPPSPYPSHREHRQLEKKRASPEKHHRPLQQCCFSALGEQHTTLQYDVRTGYQYTSYIGVSQPTARVPWFITGRVFFLASTPEQTSNIAPSTTVESIANRVPMVSPEGTQKRPSRKLSFAGMAQKKCLRDQNLKICRVNIPK